MQFVSPRDFIRRGAASHGERIAVIAGETTLSYRQLADRTAERAAALGRVGIGAGRQVGLLFRNSVEFLVWYFGALEAGAIVVPLVPTMNPAEAADLIDAAGIGFLATPEDASLPRELGMSRVAEAGTAEGACLWRSAREFRALETEPWTPEGYLVRNFSSGATGRPKHMLKREKVITFDLLKFCETHGLEKGERFLAVAPFFLSYGPLNFFAGFHLGGSVSVIDRFLPTTVLEVVRRDRITVFPATPPMIETLANCRLEEGDAAAFESLKLCVAGTGRLSKAGHDAFQSRFGVRVHVRYGSTESMSAAVDMDDEYIEGCVGRPYEGVEITVFDEDGNTLPAGELGSVTIRTPGSCEGYVDDPEITARTFRNGYVFPGDMGYFDEEGRLHLMGRSVIINVGGYKVDHLEVERIIRDSLPVTEVVVLEGKRAGLPVVRAVIEADPAVVTRAMVIDACRARLSRYKVPALVEVSERLPRDANGNILRTFFDA